MVTSAAKFFDAGAAESNALMACSKSVGEGGCDCCTTLSSIGECFVFYPHAVARTYETRYQMTDVATHHSVTYDSLEIAIFLAFLR